MGPSAPAGPLGERPRATAHRTPRSVTEAARPVPDQRTDGYDFEVMADEQAAAAQYVAYTLYRVDPAWRRLPVEERAATKDAFAEVVEEWQERMQVLSYSLVGVRPEADFMLWKLTERYEDLRDLATDLNGTPLAGWPGGRRTSWSTRS
jgi:acyl-CoA reductase-like NAD-dependent aldehyde dehydrogenase